MGFENWYLQWCYSELRNLFLRNRLPLHWPGTVYWHGIVLHGNGMLLIGWMIYSPLMIALPCGDKWLLTGRRYCAGLLLCLVVCAWYCLTIDCRLLAGCYLCQGYWLRWSACIGVIAGFYGRWIDLGKLVLPVLVECREGGLIALWWSLGYLAAVGCCLRGCLDFVDFTGHKVWDGLLLPYFPQHWFAWVKHGFTYFYWILIQLYYLFGSNTIVLYLAFSYLIGKVTRNLIISELCRFCGLGDKVNEITCLVYLFFEGI